MTNRPDSKRPSLFDAIANATSTGIAKRHDARLAVIVKKEGNVGLAMKRLAGEPIQLEEGQNLFDQQPYIWAVEHALKKIRKPNLSQNVTRRTLFSLTEIITPDFDFPDLRERKFTRRNSSIVITDTARIINYLHEIDAVGISNFSLAIIRYLIDYPRALSYIDDMVTKRKRFYWDGSENFQMRPNYLSPAESYSRWMPLKLVAEYSLKTQTEPGSLAKLFQASE